MSTKLPSWATTGSTVKPSPITTYANSSGNDTDWRPESLRRMLSGLFTSFAVMGSLETIAIIVLNISLIVIVLTSSSLRRTLRNKLVMSLAISNLLIGVYSTPFSVDFVVSMGWKHGCLVELTRELLTEYVQNFVAMWGVFLLLLHYAARLSDFHPPACVILRLHPLLLRVSSWLYVLLPWLLVAAVVVPVLFTGLYYNLWLYLDYQRCPLFTTDVTNIVLNIISGYLPSLAIAVVLVVIVVRVNTGRATWLAVTKADFHPTTGGDNDPQRVEAGSAGLVTLDSDNDLDPALVHVLVGVATVLLMLPQHLFMVVRRHYKQRQWLPELKGHVSLQLLEESLPIFLALFWLCMLPDVAERRRELCCVLKERLLACRASCCRFRSPPSEPGLPTVSYRDLHHE